MLMEDSSSGWPTENRGFPNVFTSMRKNSFDDVPGPSTSRGVSRFGTNSSFGRYSPKYAEPVDEWGAGFSSSDYTRPGEKIDVGDTEEFPSLSDSHRINGRSRVQDRKKVVKKTPEMIWKETQRPDNRDVITVIPVVNNIKPECQLSGFASCSLPKEDQRDVDNARQFRSWLPDETPVEENFIIPMQQKGSDFDWSNTLPTRDIMATVRLHGARKEVWMSPDVMSGSYDAMRKNTLIKMRFGLIMESFSTSADPLRRVKLFASDRYNYKEDISIEEENLMTSYYPQKMMSSSMEVGQPHANNHSLLFSDGGSCQVLWKGTSTSLLFKVQMFDTQRSIEDYFRRKYEGVVKVRFVGNYYRQKWPNVSEHLDQCYIVHFSSTKLCANALQCSTVPSPISPIMHCPRNLLPTYDSSSAMGKTFRLDLRWFKRPYRYLTNRPVATICLRDNRDVLWCQTVLRKHSFEAVPPEDKEFNPYNRQLGVISSVIPRSLHYDDLLTDFFQQILSPNGIEIENAYWDRYNLQEDRFKTEPSARICKRILMAAVESKVMDEVLPTSVEEWDELLKNSDRFPWKVTVRQARKQDIEHTATVEFYDHKIGIAVANILVPNSPDSNVFHLNSNDCIGVRCLPEYSVAIPVTSQIRRVCDEEIKNIDMEEREESDDRERKDWIRIQDYAEAPDLDLKQKYLVVCGYPVSRVDSIVNRLTNMMKGERLDCSAESFGLLYGHGARWVNKVKKDFSDKLVMDICLMDKCIILIGSEENRKAAREKLMIYVNEKNRLRIDTNIPIGAPRYLNVMRDALEYLTCKKLRELCGGPTLSFDNIKKAIVFSGSVEQYDTLIAYIDDLDQKIISSCKVPGMISSRPQCHVCLAPVQNAFYCLDLCGHYYCLECIIFQVSSNVKTRSFPMKCIHPECDKLISLADLKRLYLGNDELPSWLSLHRMSPLLISSLDAHLILSKSIVVPCSTPSCNGLRRRDDFPRGIAVIVECEVCKVKRCSECNEDPHPQMSCIQHKKLRKDWMYSLETYINTKKGLVRTCPNEACQTVILKETGCSHIHCLGCNKHFCWQCKFFADTQAEVYSHLGDVHGNSGGGWRIENGIVLEAPPGEMDNALDQDIVDQLGDMDIEEIMDLIGIVQ